MKKGNHTFRLERPKGILTYFFSPITRMIKICLKTTLTTRSLISQTTTKGWKRRITLRHWIMVVIKCLVLSNSRKIKNPKLGTRILIKQISSTSYLTQGINSPSKEKSKRSTKSDPRLLIEGRFALACLYLKKVETLQPSRSKGIFCKLLLDLYWTD